MMPDSVSSPVMASILPPAADKSNARALLIAPSSARVPPPLVKTIAAAAAPSAALEVVSTRALAEMLVPAKVLRTLLSCSVPEPAAFKVLPLMMPLSLSMRPLLRAMVVVLPRTTALSTFRPSTANARLFATWLPKVMVPVPSASLSAMVRLPWLTLTPPEKVLAPPRTSVPEPVLSRPLAPVMTASTVAVASGSTLISPVALVISSPPPLLRT